MRGGSATERDAGLYATLAFRAWSVVQGPATAALVVAMLTPEAQASWYVLQAFARWQTLGDLGFGGLIQRFASHEAAFPDDPVHRARLAALPRIAVAYALVAGAVMLAGLGLAGRLVLTRAEAESAIGAWTVLAVLTVAAWGGGLATLPVLEGSGHVAAGATARLLQSALGRLTALAALAVGGGIWGLVAERLVALGVLAGVVARDRASFPSAGGDPAVRAALRREIAPVFARTALATVGGFLPWAVALPGALVWLGPADAGRLGLGLAVLGGFSSLCEGMVQARVPAMSMAGARRRDTRAEWWRVAGRAAAALAVLAAAFALACAAWHALALPRADRLPTPPGALLLAGATVVRFARGQLLVWARSWREEPVWPVDLVGGLVTVAVLVLAARSGLVPMLAGWLAVDVAVVLATVAVLRTWRAPPTASSPP